MLNRSHLHTGPTSSRNPLCFNLLKVTVWQHLSRDCRSVYDSIRSIGLSHSVSEKLARLLLHWSADVKTSDGTVRIKLALTHEEIAQLIGSSRETVTRILGEFKKRRLVELNGSTLVLRNKAALESLAGS